MEGRLQVLLILLQELHPFYQLFTRLILFFYLVTQSGCILFNEVQFLLNLLQMPHLYEFGLFPHKLLDMWPKISFECLFHLFDFFFEFEVVVFAPDKHFVIFIIFQGPFVPFYRIHGCVNLSQVFLYVFFIPLQDQKFFVDLILVVSSCRLILFELQFDFSVIILKMIGIPIHGIVELKFVSIHFFAERTDRSSIHPLHLFPLLSYRFECLTFALQGACLPSQSLEVPLHS